MCAYLDDCYDYRKDKERSGGLFITSVWIGQFKIGCCIWPCKKWLHYPNDKNNNNYRFDILNYTLYDAICIFNT